MQIGPIDNVVKIVETGGHEDREHPQKRRQPQRKEQIPSGPVYKPNGKLEEEPPSKIDVLV
jgi:hypothetical protein